MKKQELNIIYAKAANDFIKIGSIPAFKLAIQVRDEWNGLIMLIDSGFPIPDALAVTKMSRNIVAKNIK